MNKKIRIIDKSNKAKKENSNFQTRNLDFSQSINSSADHIFHLQRTIGNQAVQRLVQAGDQARSKMGQPDDFHLQKVGAVADKTIEEASVNIYEDSPQMETAVVHRDLGSIKAEAPPKTSVPPSMPGLTARPTGIEKTEVIKHKLHFGARYKHTLKSSDGKLEGTHITEKVKKVKDDFKTKSPGVKLGKKKARINKKNEVADRIWISFGAIAPAVKRLREKKKTGEMLLGSTVDHQELYYWENRHPPGWKKFAEVKIEQRLYDLPGLVVVTIDNSKMANQEDFTPLPTRREEKRELQNIKGGQPVQGDIGDHMIRTKLGTRLPDNKREQKAEGDGQIMEMWEPQVQRQPEAEEVQSSGEVSGYVFSDAPVTVLPGKSRSSPFVSPERRWPLPLIGSEHGWQFWHPNLQYRRGQNGDQVWWEDYMKKDGSWYRAFWRFSPAHNSWHVGGYPLTSVTESETSYAQEKEPQLEENPEQLDLTSDPETVYGPRITSRDHVEIMGWKGHAELYLDRTIELYPEGSTLPITFRPHPGGSPNAFEFYNQKGRKTIIIVPIDINEIFGPAK